MNNVVELRPGFDLVKPRRRSKAQKEADKKRIEELEEELREAERKIEKQDNEIAELERSVSESPNEDEFCSMREEIELAEKELTEMRDNMLYRRRVYSQIEFKEAIENILDGFSRIY